MAFSHLGSDMTGSRPPADSGECGNDAPGLSKCAEFSWNQYWVLRGGLGLWRRRPSLFTSGSCFWRNFSGHLQQGAQDDPHWQCAPLALTQGDGWGIPINQLLASLRWDCNDSDQQPAWLGGIRAWCGHCLIPAFSSAHWTSAPRAGPHLSLHRRPPSRKRSV